jgi:phenylalanyl-tRNA synthetase beta chain
MKISYNWLKDYINLDVPAEALSTILTSIGLEVGGVEKVQTIRGGLEGLVVGEVLTCEKHENSDHLSVTTVDIGDDSPLQIVCGAPNVATGQKVVVAPIGAKLYSNDETFTIKRSKIRGVESFGMICAEDEIGIGTSHDGIIVLPETVSVGTLVKEYYDVEDDFVFEIDITPNRSDATSHYGVARDLAAYFSIRDNAIKLTKPDVSKFKVQSTALTIPVNIESPEACPRYSAVTIANVKVEESPQWLKDRLNSIGLRPINSIVDITNYVMHETGQPLHAFDADKVQGKRVRVKTMPNATPFTGLDGIVRKLSAEDLMICDVENPMCIGGVFGGIDSGVTETTTNIFLESAYFNPVSIRKTSKLHDLHTDASFRFERGCDPSNTVYVLKRCAMLIQEIAGGEISSEVVDVYPRVIQPAEVSISVQKIQSLIGKKIERSVIEKILQALEMTILQSDEAGYLLQIPTYRVDVQRNVDVIEDILRIYGYNNVEIGHNLSYAVSHVDDSKNQRLQQLISEQLTAQGFFEIMNNSLTKGAYYRKLSTYPENKSVKIINSLSNDLNVMRQTLLFGGLESIAYNVNRQHADLKLYEFGNCYRYDYDKKASDENADDDLLSSYREEFHLGIWITGQKHALSWTQTTQNVSVYDLKAYVEGILKRMGVNFSKLVYAPCENDIFSEAITIKTLSDRSLATYGIVHGTLLKATDLEQPVYFADLPWENILKEVKRHRILFNDMPKFPEVRRDLALLLDKNISFETIEKIAFKTERKLLKRVNLFDVYEGKNLDPGKKSYAVSFYIQDAAKTLTDTEIDGVMKKLIKNFEQELGAKLR